MQIFIGIPIKWIFRLGLALFYLSGIWAHLQGTNFFGWLVRDHIHITTAIIFLTIITFVSPFFSIKRKTRDGGEKDMRKLAWFVIIVFATVLAVAIGCAADDSFKASVIAVLTGISGPIYVTASTGWSNFATVIGTSGTYFLIYTIGILITGGIVFVALTHIKDSGKLPSLRKTSSPSVGSSGIGAPIGNPITPAGATTRPETATNADATLKVPLEPMTTEESEA